MTRIFKFALAAFAAYGFISPTAVAETKPGIEVVSVRVSYGDLDMSKPAGGATLLKRLESAARKVCGETAIRSSLLPRSIANCRREVIENTVRTADLTTLTLAWSGKYPATQTASR